jgi:streptomycin 3"-adenylyltransferase
MTVRLDNESEEQIMQCLNLLTDILEEDLLGVYLYGSAIVGGLQKYSDIELFVVSNRSTTYQEKAKLITALLTISGNYMNSLKRPIEMTMVVNSEVNPWQYPPTFDFQYGDWLCTEFESGYIEPWPTKEMPDLALLITQVLLASKNLWGPSLEQLLSKVPYQDFMHAAVAALDNLMAELNKDARNALLTLARVWSTLETNQIRSKSDAAS